MPFRLLLVNVLVQIALVSRTRSSDTRSHDRPPASRPI